MMRINYHFFCLIMGILFISPNLTAQNASFDETWKEFLDNNKISNMSALAKPNKVTDRLDYIKYLLMNTNSSFCQSKVADAERLVAQINEVDPRAHQAIPGFVGKKEDLEKKIKAYHSIDAIWKRFIRTQEVDIESLEAITAAKTLCEKQTLAKYSYMMAYYDFCNGNVSKARNIIENRTLRLTEQTSLRVEDVEGLAPELARMKKLFQNMSKLETNWRNYMKTGVSPGFPIELPLFPCYPIPNMKEWVLRGAADVCNSGVTMLEKVKQLQSESGVDLGRELTEKVAELERSIEDKETELSILNESWEAFIPYNEVGSNRRYGYNYCSKEPLIRAYIMDGFANVCGMAEEMLQEIDKLQKSDRRLNLADVTLTKINQLKALYIQTNTDAVDINDIWNSFVRQGEASYREGQLAEYYCDHIHDVKSWVIKGVSGTCKEGRQYIAQIDEVKNNLEFEFDKEVTCQVEKLRVQVWDCSYQAVKNLAVAQASSPNTVEEKLAELMEEYGMGARPEGCVE